VQQNAKVQDDPNAPGHPWAAEATSDPHEAAGASLGWYDETMDAAHWADLSDVTPAEAAMLLCRFDPNAESQAVASEHSTDETVPGDFRKLQRRFEDLARSEPRARKLRDWYDAAKHMRLKHHSWVREYFDALEVVEQRQLVKQQQPGREGASEQQCKSGGKRWTAENLEELKQYRRKHGTKEAAKAFGISTARVRALLPIPEAQKQMPARLPSVFTHLIK
jgi:hypothetical protein